MEPEQLTDWQKAHEAANMAAQLMPALVQLVGALAVLLRDWPAHPIHNAAALLKEPPAQG